MADQKSRWDTAYEWKAVTLLSLGFGLVGLDRWIIGPLFPFIMKDLGLNYGQIGALAGILAVCWGVSAILMGNVSDKIGRRWVLIPSIILFSLLSGLSGVAGSFAMLMMIRGVMGCTEGAFTPPSVAATAEASKPTRRGLNQGFQLSLFALFGLGLGPIVATQLLRVVPSWRYVFMAVGIPGVILAILMFFIIREPNRTRPDHHAHGPARWLDAMRSRNIIVGVVAVLCAMCGIFVIGAMMPSYLMDYLKLSPSQMGLVMSAIGFGGFFGEFALPGLSDFLGRKVVAIATFIVGLVLVRIFAATGAQPTILAVLLFFIGFCCMGLLAVFTGPIPTEAVSPTLIASAIGLVSGSGEIFGGGVAPAVGGWVAQTYGIQHILDLASAGLIAGCVATFFLRETAPRRVRAADPAKAVVGDGARQAS
jgi:predicted MFS family arabinose efflux permease